jgi:hypothetical protein
MPDGGMKIQGAQSQGIPIAPAGVGPWQTVLRATDRLQLSNSATTVVSLITVAAGKQFSLVDLVLTTTSTTGLNVILKDGTTVVGQFHIAAGGPVSLSFAAGPQGTAGASFSLTFPIDAGTSFVGYYLSGVSQ